MIFTIVFAIGLALPLIHIKKYKKEFLPCDSNKILFFKKMRGVFLCFIILGCLILIYIFNKINVIPIFSPLEYKLARREVRAQELYTIYTITIISVPMLYYSVYRIGAKFTITEKFVVLSWFILSAFTGWTGNVVYPLVMSLAVILNLRDNKTSEAKIIFAGFSLILFIFFSVSTMRAIFNLGLDFELNILSDYRVWGRFFSYLAEPFHNLDEVLAVSKQRSYGVNTFIFLQNLPWVGSSIEYWYTQWLNAFTLELGENIYNRGANTLTFIAPLYFDFGFWGTLVVCLSLSIVISFSYRRYLLTSQSTRGSQVWVAISTSFAMVTFMLFTGLHIRMLSFYVWPVLVAFVASVCYTSVKYRPNA